MIEFDPNNQTKSGVKIPVWATYIPSRHPNFKTHHQKNHATAAINYRSNGYFYGGSPGILYQLSDGKWVEIDRYEPPTECAHCGGGFSYEKDEGRWGVRTTTSYHRVDHHPAKPSYKKPVVCHGCYESHFCYRAPNPINPEWVGQVNPI